MHFLSIQEMKLLLNTQAVLGHRRIKINVGILLQHRLACLTNLGFQISSELTLSSTVHFCISVSLKFFLYWTRMKILVLYLNPIQALKARKLGHYEIDIFFKDKTNL